MKLILSRKGFDSGVGKCASPIFPNGRMCSLPIPSRHSATRYDDLLLAGHSGGRLVSDLTKGTTKPSHNVHHDPDLDPAAMKRAPGWRGLFGQGGAAQKVLAGEGVGPGDVFVFFGWFRQVEEHGGKWRFVKGSPDVHVLFGWLQVERVIDVARERAAIPEWAEPHPHVTNGDYIDYSTLYVATEELSLGGQQTATKGSGVFATFDRGRQLTRVGASRSLWDLPGWFQPRRDRPPLGYHGKATRWRRRGDRVELQSVARGQEFVLDGAHYSELEGWLRELLCTAA